MAHKCSGCFYRTEWGGGTGETKYPICERGWWKSFEECKAECEKPGECEFKMEPFSREAKAAKEFVSYLKENTKRLVIEDLEKARLED